VMSKCVLSRFSELVQLPPLTEGNYANWVSTSLTYPQ
jgi:hypothetical protein